MKISLVVACAAACFATGVVVAEDTVDESKPIELTALQMDQITAGDLTTPGNKVFEGFDNPAPGDFHPALLKGVHTEGPWQAHFQTNGVIVCADC